MKKMLLVLATLCGLFFVHTQMVSADYTTHTDTTGSVTGVKNATYYNVSSWSDMFSAYRNSSESTVYLNVTNDIPGSSAAVTGQEVAEGKSLKIIGNGKTLYFGADTDPTVGTGKDYDVRYPSSGFYANDQGRGKLTTSNTTLTLENAKWVNSINYGIFEVSGDAQAKTIFKDVTETNGAITNTAGATVIANRAGAIEFYGKKPIQYNEC